MCCTEVVPQRAEAHHTEHGGHCVHACVHVCRIRGGGRKVSVVEDV